MDKINHHERHRIHGKGFPSVSFVYSVVSLFGFLAPASAAETLAYRAARLWPGDGPAIADAVLIVRDGKVVAAGPRNSTNIPTDAVVHDLGDAVIIPGLIAAETTLAEKGRDDQHALTPHHRAIDGFDPYADYSAALAGGVTTVQLAPGGKRLLPGQGAVVKLSGDDLAHRTLRETESLRVVFGDAFKNPPRIYEPPVGAVSVDRPLEQTKPQMAASLGGAVAGIRATFKAAREAPSGSDAFLRAVAAAGTPRQPIRITVPAASDVQAALSLAREFDLRLVLVEPAVPREKLESWKPHVAGVVLAPGLRPGSISDDGPSRTAAEAARDLRAASIKTALKPASDADLKDLLYLAGLLTSRSTPVEVMRMLTSDAAALLGVSDRIGTLTAGKDADFVVLNGDPFALRTRVQSVYVDGHPAFEGKQAGPRKVVRASRVLTGAGETINNGAILVDGRSIRAVGRDVSTPADAEEKRFPANTVIVPGFLDLGNGIGVGGAISTPIAINTRLGDRLVASDSAAKTARQGGVTTALLSGPAPSPVLAFKFADRLRPVKDPVALRLALRGNLTTSGASLRDSLRAAKSYTDAWAKYETDFADYQRKKQEFDAAQAKAAAEKKDEKKPDEKKPDDKKPDDKKPEEKKPEGPKAPDKPQTVEALEPFRALFLGKIPALVEASREDAIRLAVTICRDEFNIRTVLVGATDAHRVADLLASKSVAVIAGPELLRTVEREDVNLPMALAVRGAPFGFQSQATSGARYLPTAVGYAVRHGLGTDEALRGLTSMPAQFLGLETLGSLAIGKDADLVVLSGMPFELSTRVLAVMIDGQWVYREE
jgi:imidazolonepropionase-like amidohydrolase